MVFVRINKAGAVGRAERPKTLRGARFARPMVAFSLIMCISPIHAWRGRECDSRGVYHFYFTPPADYESFVKLYQPLPCGKCLGCLDDRRNRWSNRLLLEFDNSRCGSFITLTYNEEHVPDRPLKSAVQKFLKRFRNIPRDLGLPPLPDDFRYFFCGESGGTYGRPHYHGLLFNVDLLADCWKPYIATFKDGKPIISSKVLEEKWPYGFCSVDTITPKRCRYITKYTLKQVGQEHSFTLKSMRLGVCEFFDFHRNGRKFDYSFKRPDSAEMLTRGYVHVSGENGRVSKIRIPPALVKYVERVDPNLFLDISLYRQFDALLYASKKFDRDAYVARLESENHKEKLKRKRKLHS